MLAGEGKLCTNEFTRIPRGHLRLRVEQLSIFKKDKYTHMKDLIVLMTKTVSRTGDKLVQRVTEQDLVPPNDKEPDDYDDAVLKFETYHYDDFVKVEVFHRGSEQKNSKVGKAFLRMRDLVYSQEDKKQAFCVALQPSNYGEKRDRVNGQLFLSAEYEGRPANLFYPEWMTALYNSSKDNEEIIDRYEHFNDLLSNEFADDCQFGTL